MHLSDYQQCILTTTVSYYVLILFKCTFRLDCTIGNDKGWIIDFEESQLFEIS